MSSTMRLHEVQAALLQRGARDVKFFLAASAETTGSRVADDAANLLRAHLDGRCTPVEKIGDSK